jgi:hypothetical protein
MFGESEHMAELAEAVSKLAAQRVADMATAHEQRLEAFFDALSNSGDIDGPPAGLSAPQIVRMLMRGADAVKHAPEVRGNPQQLRTEFGALSILVLAAMGLR